jgi:G:T-mismatch repair DNA endonuclease (very short patch repair protein)/DNA-binding CsgD family transcriptional regulator
MEGIMNSVKPNKSTLEKHYIEDAIKMSDIAKMYGVPVRRVGKWLSSYGIKNPNKLLRPTKDELHHWYWIDKLTMPEIARRCGCTYQNVRQWFLKLNIPIRSNSEAQVLSNGTGGFTKELLEQLYTEQGLSQSQIGLRFNITQSAVKFWLKRFKIPARNTSNVGSKNGMYGRTHTDEVKQRLRESVAVQFSKPGAREHHAIKTCEQIKSGNTGKAYNKLETKFAAMLDMMSVQYECQYRIGRFLFDFYVPFFNLLIEVHGTFWHADPRRYNHLQLTPIQQRNVSNDVRKSERAIRDGFNLIVFWESDIDKIHL